MERKYKVSLVAAIIPMMIDFNKIESGDSYKIHANVDMTNDRVYFIGDEIEGIDYEDLEQEVLFNLRPVLLEAPAMPDDLKEKIAKNRSRM
jgi:uncharacterized lipoprotein YbaY